MSPLIPLVFTLAATLAPNNDVDNKRPNDTKVTQQQRDSAFSEQTTNETAATNDDQPCHWWQRISGRCPDSQDALEGLPPEAPKKGVVVAVDTTNNLIYLYQDGQLVDKGPAATGSGKYLKRGLREWLFHTPRGRQVVRRKLVDPIWTKPDWAFVEAGQPVPPPNSPKRQVKGHLGKYALDLGDGIMIHGTDDPGSLGKKVSHGCIRVGDELLEKIYQNASIGTEVYVY